MIPYYQCPKILLPNQPFHRQLFLQVCSPFMWQLSMLTFHFVVSVGALCQSFLIFVFCLIDSLISTCPLEPLSFEIPGVITKQDLFPLSTSPHAENTDAFDTGSYNLTKIVVFSIFSVVLGLYDFSPCLKGCGLP